MTPDEILQDFQEKRSEAKNANQRGIAYDNTLEAIKQWGREMCDKQKEECTMAVSVYDNEDVELSCDNAPYPKELQ